MLDERESASFIGSSFYLNSILITVLLPALHNATRLLCSFIVQLDDNFAKNLRLSTIGRMPINYLKYCAFSFGKIAKWSLLDFQTYDFWKFLTLTENQYMVFFLRGKRCMIFKNCKAGCKVNFYDVEQWCSQDFRSRGVQFF